MMRRIVVAAALAFVSACSSSDDTNAGVPAPCDQLEDACCCNNGVRIPFVCTGAMTHACPEGYSYMSGDCGMFCRPSPDASIDALRDAIDEVDAPKCDAHGYCCCEIDVLVDPVCSDAGLSCPSPYRLLTPAQCATDCVLRYDDTGPRDGEAPHD